MRWETLSITDNNLTVNSGLRRGREDTRIGCHVCHSAGVEEPFCPTAARVVEGHVVEGVVETGRECVGAVGVVGVWWRRERRHCMGWANARACAEKARPPHVHRPGLDHALPLLWWRSARRRGSAGWSTLATGGILAVATISCLALLTAVVVPVVGRRGRWWSRRDGPGRSVGRRGRRKECCLRLHLMGVSYPVLFLHEVGFGVEKGGVGS